MESQNELTPEKIIKILKKEEIDISIEEAKIILDFVNRIVRIAVNQYLRRCL